MSSSNKRALRVLGLLLLNLALLFLGWGLDDSASFFRHPARAGLVVVAILNSAIAMLCDVDVQPFPKGPQPAGRWAPRLWLVVGLFWVWFLPLGDRRGWLVLASAHTLRYAGLMLYAAGGAARLVAARTLGKQLSTYVTLKEDHQLVQTGIYRLLRHPIYLGILLSMAGLPLIFRSWLVIPIFVLNLINVLGRIRWEDKLLNDHFGHKFEAYRSRTKRLLPYLY